MTRKKATLPVNLLTIAAAVIVVAFFLPWVKFGVSYAGYEIPDIARVVGKATSLRSWTGKFDINVYLVYALFLVPISAAAIIVLSVLARDTRPAAWIAAVMPLTGLAYGVVRQGLDVFPRVGLGGWLTIAAAAVMLLALLNVIKYQGDR
ncbi:MAG: hypothetical protein ACC641_07540 [Acidiferrobacterales bacterium]